MLRPAAACAVLLLLSTSAVLAQAAPGLPMDGTPTPPARPAELTAPPATPPAAGTPPVAGMQAAGTPPVAGMPPDYEAAIASDTQLVRPWQAWTPGAVRSTDKAEICGTGTSEIRKSLRSSTKRTVGRRYRVAKGGAFVYDHLVPLSVGGAPDDPNNLWPQPRRQAKKKDVCENRARAMVCSRGTLELAEAQRGFSTDFFAFCASIGAPQMSGTTSN